MDKFVFFLINPLLTLVFIICAASAGAQAQGVAPTLQTAPIPVSLTLSGGVSLGAYQAGALYYLSLLAHENPERLQLKLITGASAGGINALLAALSFCGVEAQDPEQSEFWRSWVSWSGGELLTNSQNADPRALLSRQPLEKIAAQLYSDWKQGLSPNCDVVLGLTATRLKPEQLATTSALQLERQSDEIALRIRGRGTGRSALITNYALAPGEVPQTLLALTSGDDEQNFGSLRDLLFASSAFPVAFAPQKLSICTTDTSPRWLHADFPLTCNEKDIQTADYVDGGLVDNEPIALAYELARDGLTQSDAGLTNWQEIPQVRESATAGAEATLFMNIDLSNTSFAPKVAQVDSRHVLPLTASLIGDFLNSSRDRDAFSTLVRNPRFGLQIASLRNVYPRISDPLLGFFGFFERDFRAFDFYLGLIEMREFSRSTLLQSLRVGEISVGAKLKLPTIEKMPLRDLRRLNCLEAWLQQKPDAKNLCEQMDDDAFFTLTRLSLARLKAQDASLDFIFHFLTQENYLYRDLDLSPLRAGRAPALIKEKAIDAISHLASLQPLTDDLVLRAATPLLLATAAHLPTARDFSFVTGPETTFEMSSLLQNDVPYAIRWTLGLSLENLPGWFATDGGRVVSTPWLGLEWQPPSLNSSFLQTRVGLGLGYKFGESDTNFSCAAGKSIPVDCRGLAIRPSLAWTLIERIRVEAAFEVMPMTSPAGRIPIEFLPALGLQFYY